MSYLLVIVGLLALIFLHELGHFLAARAVGITAPKFYIGFPPAVVSFRRWGTEFGIGLTMLGGYVKLSGMFRPRPGEIAWRMEPLVVELKALCKQDDRLRIDADYRALSRSQTMEELCTAAASFRYSLSQLSAEAAAADVRQRLDDWLQDVIYDAGPGAYWRAALWRRMVVIAAGPLVNVVIAAVVLFVAFLWFTPGEPTSFKVGKVQESSPAERAGLRAGDRIVEWDGVPADDTAFMQSVARASTSPVEVVLERNGSTERRVISRARIEGRQLVGVQIAVRTTRDRTFGEAAGLVLPQMKAITVGTIRAVGGVFSTERRKEIGGIYGIVESAPEFGRLGVIPLVLAAISLSLAIVNLLPILPLDGGHIAFGVIEALRRGRPLPREMYERYSMLGLVFILVLFVIGLQNDLQR